MYFLSVGAIFKNEEHCIKEWIEHYLSHGVEHFYLINDSSTDASVEILQFYINKGIVTLYNSAYSYFLSRQCHMYNEFIKPHLNNKDTKWLLMVDLDEFMWSPISKHIPDILNTCEHFGQIQVNHTLYGSNGHIEQPDSIVKYFTKRSENQPSNLPHGNLKYFVNSAYNFESLNVHHASFQNKEHDHNCNIFVLLGPQYFILNHYCCQSLQFWKDIKCTRGDGDAYRVRTESDFHIYDINHIEDLGLFEQNNT